MLSRLWAKDPPKSLSPRLFEVGALSLPHKGEELCGDAWTVIQQPNRVLMMVVDGLGHGRDASEASHQAVRVFNENRTLSPAEMMDRIHSALKSTRGATAAVAEVNPERQLVRFSGVGNISALILSSESSRNMVSHNGTLGHEVYKIQEHQYPFQAVAGVWPLIVMHSDGLSARWSIENYPGLFGKHPSLIAALLYRDFQRERDDVTVLVARKK